MDENGVYYFNGFEFGDYIVIVNFISFVWGVFGVIVLLNV